MEDSSVLWNADRRINYMGNLATTPRPKQLTVAVITSFLFVLPLLVLEIRNNDQRFPWPLFAFLWVLPASFILVLGNALKAPKLSSIAISSVS